jgi:plastocyanin
MRQQKLTPDRPHRLRALDSGFALRGTWILLSITVALALALVPRAGRAAGAASDTRPHPHMAMDGPDAMADMSEAEMRAHADAYWATHLPVGPATAAPASTQAAATVTVNNFYFDNDGTSATKVDTVRISTGESVTWQWVIGIHTITSGTGSGDPDVGLLFDQPSDSGHPQFTFQFDNPGTYPYFCSIHEISGMKGVVVVTATSGVPPVGGAEAVGFAGDPVPNPTTAGATFRFALASGGRAHAEVFDAAGRRVASVLDQELPAGTHTATWDGRAGDHLASPGVYYLRLEVPGFVGSRTLVVRR